MAEYKAISISMYGKPRELFVFNISIDKMKTDRVPENELWEFFCKEVREKLKTMYDMKSRYLVVKQDVVVVSFRDINKSNRRIIYIEPPEKSNSYYTREANTCIPVIDDD